ncbi:hypothetical protein B0H16DRAFT_582043 [Mycena metata]|uniref:Uncharacterized protein n=1 Tax=Mycena metata TaxID=1033252 RepID=A0AAD7H4Q7_9AGAR|nr:hypothetical protein B0H16DRAFT_582043 [Mycena metata]
MPLLIYFPVTERHYDSGKLIRERLGIVLEGLPCVPLIFSFFLKCMPFLSAPLANARSGEHGWRRTRYRCCAARFPFSAVLSPALQVTTHPHSLRSVLHIPRRELCVLPEGTRGLWRAKGLGIDTVKLILLAPNLNPWHDFTPPALQFRPSSAGASTLSSDFMLRTAAPQSSRFASLLQSPCHQVQLCTAYSRRMSFWLPSLARPPPPPVL